MTATHARSLVLDEFLLERSGAGDFPSASYAVCKDGVVANANAIGNAVVTPRVIEANPETIYDLASLTKPLITGFLCATLVQAGGLNIDESVAHYLDEFASNEKRSITIRQLLTHTSGLPAWKPMRMICDRDPANALKAIGAESLVAEPGDKLIYSDLGFITLGFVVEKISGSKLDQLARARLFEPLGLTRTFLNPPSELRGEIAASEIGNRYESEMSGTTGYSPVPGDFRDDVVWGQVHDGNAWFLGGFAGHAGLFSTATETARIAEQFIPDRSKLLSRNVCELFRQNMTSGLGENRSFSWQLASTTDSSAGPDINPNSFGHNGFTGTSCWVDSESDRIYVLLTNRTHHPLPFVNINGVRRRFNSLASFSFNSSE